MYHNLYIAVQAIISVTVETVSTTSATLECTLPCFSPNLQCNLFNITTNGVDAVNITNGNIFGSVMSYSYPTQNITINNLMESTAYNYCVVAINITNMMKIGEAVCGSFIARPLPPPPATTTTTTSTPGNNYIRKYVTYVRMYNNNVLECV